MVSRTKEKKSCTIEIMYRNYQIVYKVLNRKDKSTTRKHYYEDKSHTIRSIFQQI